VLPLALQIISIASTKPQYSRSWNLYSFPFFHRTMVTSSAQDDTRTVDRSILFNAINSASPSRLQAVLREICSVEPKAYKLACDLLLVAIDDDNNSSNNNSDAAVASPPPKHKLDTLQQRFEVCVQCKEEFDVSKNLEGDCMWHSGTLCTHFSPARTRLTPRRRTRARLAKRFLV
jgi:hypothetical protein